MKSRDLPLRLFFGFAALILAVVGAVLYGPLVILIASGSGAASALLFAYLLLFLAALAGVVKPRWWRYSLLAAAVAGLVGAGTAKLDEDEVFASHRAHCEELLGRPDCSFASEVDMTCTLGENMRMGTSIEQCRKFPELMTALQEKHRAQFDHRRDREGRAVSPKLRSVLQRFSETVYGIYLRPEAGAPDPRLAVLRDIRSCLEATVTPDDKSPEELAYHEQWNVPSDVALVAQAYEEFRARHADHFARKGGGMIHFLPEGAEPGGCDRLGL